MKTFSLGGIHPPEYKLTSHIPICQVPLPQEVTILLNQHTGAPSIPLVKRGDRVRTGQLIAKANGFVSANLHASVAGKVTKLTEVMDTSGYRREAIVIETEGDEWIDEVDTSSKLITYCPLSPEEIIKRIELAGVVGMGGACFPTHVKLSPPAGKKIENLLINAVECEPFLTADHRLMLEKGAEIMTGIQLLLQATGARQAIVGIEANKMDAVHHLKQLNTANSSIKIVPLQVKYPQGSEKQLIQALTGRRVPSGGLPVDVGAVVLNVATVFAIYEAVQKNKP